MEQRIALAARPDDRVSYDHVDLLLFLPFAGATSRVSVSSAFVLLHPWIAD